MQSPLTIWISVWGSGEGLEGSIGSWNRKSRAASGVADTITCPKLWVGIAVLSWFAMKSVLTALVEFGG